MDGPETDPAPRDAPHRLTRAWQPAWRLRPAFLSRRRNVVTGSGLAAAVLRLTTLFYGLSSDNAVRFGANFRTKGLFITVEGAGNEIVVGDDVRLDGEINLCGFGLRLTIGDRTDMKDCKIVARDGNVAIGSDCLIAANVLLRTSDMHVITDRASGAPVNPPADVVVGNGVWIAGEAALLKGARVPDGCVVGFRAVVTSAFDEAGCVIAGSPARVIRRGVSWRR